MRKVLRVSIYCVLLAVVPLSAFFLLPTSVRYRITERYAFAAGRPGVGVHLAIMLPKSGPYQAVENVVVDWSGAEARESHESVDVVMLDGVTGDDGTLEAALTYDVALRQGGVWWNDPVKEEYLAAESEIESDAPMLVRKAEEIAADPSRKGVYRIYAFTVRHLSWPSGTREGGGQSALTAYQTGIGVCGERANLMTALCRASGIPAKSITGLSLPWLLPPYVTRRGAWAQHPGGSHAWAEVHSEEGWQLVDPTLASRLPLDRLLFGRSFGQHLSYGDSSQHARVYEGMMAWGRSRGEIAGAMSAPFKFVTAVDEEGVTVSPVVSVRKARDVRWFVGVGVYVAILVTADFFERRLQRANEDTTSG